MTKDETRSSGDKAERLAAALRENLRRRKSQARALEDSASVPAKAGTQDQKIDPTQAASE